MTRRAAAGFTLLELMVVVALLAVAVAMVTLNLRDADADRLDEEATRLSALFEAARAQSRATGAAVRWLPHRTDTAPGFEFIGLAANPPPAAKWLDERTTAQVAGAAAIQLGPEPVIGAQSVTLQLAGRSLNLATDGIAPFAVRDPADATDPPATMAVPAPENGK